MLTFRPVRADESPGSGLVVAMLDELAPFYGPLDAPGMPSASPAEMAPPHGAFLVGELDDRLVACGGLKRLEPRAAEIKRMYVAPAARGQGVARALLGALEDAARELGYERTRLDTGPRQPHAQALYESAGYTAIDNYNANPQASFWGEKTF